MSLSDDDDDFLSADEEGFCSDQKTLSTVGGKNVTDLKQADHFVKIEPANKCKIPRKAIEAFETGREANFQEDKSVVEEVVESVEKTGSLQEGPVRNDDVNDEEDEEEALVERIRERNLKIARKFSAEITKSVKSSAPIPVKGQPNIGFKVNDTECQNIPGSEAQSSPPPAPPPTPALSSSFNSDEPSGSLSMEGSQYGWRLPAKLKNIGAESLSPHSKSEQARQALDRLSEKLYESDKNLFEKVAEDIKKVSIKSGEPSASADSAGASGSASGGMPLLSDLTSTLGGWNWNSASRLLASASQVTSQVGSVLDSVVNASQQMPQASPQPSMPQAGSSRQPEVDSREKTSDPQTKSPSTPGKPSSSPTDAISNDVLVDFTLNAMESLGKKAFGVMTERDESGSLQIKGLGRPWEHLLNLKKSESAQGVSPSAAEEPEPQDVVTQSSRDPKRGVDQSPSGLVNRKKRLTYEEDNNLD